MIQMVKFEFQKLLHKKIVYIGLLLIAGLNILMYINWSGPSYTVRTSDKTYLEGTEAIAYDKEIAARYAGELTDDKVQQILRDYPRDGENENKFVLENDTYGTIANRFANFDGTWDGTLVEESFTNEQGSLRLGYSKGWTRFLYYVSNVLIWAGFLIIIVIAPVFSDEYTNGMDALILTSRYGKKQCAKAKIIAAYLFSFSITAIIIIIDILVQLIVLGVEGWNASVQLNSMGLFRNVPYTLNYAQATGFGILLWLVSAMTLTGIVTALSAISKSPFITLVLSLLCYSIPVFINEQDQVLKALLALNPIRSMQLSTVFDIRKIQILNHQIMYAWVVCVFMWGVVTLTYISAKKVFEKHQVM